MNTNATYVKNVVESYSEMEKTKKEEIFIICKKITKCGFTGKCLM